MDKYEFNIKVEQIRKLVNKGDFATAMKITDTIDWKKVRNTSLLSMVSQVYEKNGEYQDAKDILLLAFERAPIGKRLLYKLTELALKEGSLEEAEAYYREFCDLAADDPRQHLLRFMILKEKDAPIEQLIHSLEGYTAEELDEKWLYELAELYHEAGDSARCVSTCDKIMLMFGLGKYVDKAMELKLQYAPLTKYQMDLVENREKYEARLRAVEQSFQDVTDSEEEYIEETQETEKAIADSAYTPSYETSRDISHDVSPESNQAEGLTDESIRADVHQAETEESLKREMSRMVSTEPAPEAEDDLGKTRILGEIHRRRPVQDLGAAQEAIPVSVAAETADMSTSAVEEKQPAEANLQTHGADKAVKHSNHLMVEARTPDKGLELAVETLRKIQRETGVKNPVAKITGSKLNKRGVLASADKLAGKDLMIEEAGDLTPETILELEKFMEQDTQGIRVILIDNPRQMELLHAKNPSLANSFQCVASSDAFKADEQKEKTPAAVNKASETQKASEMQAMPETQKTPAMRRGSEASMGADAGAGEPADETPVVDNRPVRRVTPVRDGAMRAPDTQELRQDFDLEDQEPEDDEEEMNIDEFAQYACKYASEIDCSITGKSMLALYERIEIMEEDGIPLTRVTAEELIEEAADRAEKPSLGKAIKGIFSSKYDKDGLLILKEEHFI